MTAQVTNPMKDCTLIRAHSMGDFLDWLEPRNADANYWPTRLDRGFYGPAGTGPRDWANYVDKGASEAEQATVNALLGKIDAGLNRKHAKMVPCVAGSRVNVSEYLTGHPLHMRRRQKVEKATAPVRVYVDVSVWAGASAEQVAKRGAAIAAFVMRLSETRAVELWAASATTIYGHTAMTAVKLDCHPISIAQVTAVFCSNQYNRGLTLPAGAKTVGRDINRCEGFPYAWGGELYNDSRYMRNMRAALQCAEQDVFIPFLSDRNIREMSDPVAWVHKMLKDQRGEGA